MASDNSATPSSSTVPTAPQIATTAMDAGDPNSFQDPLPPVLREGDHFLLHFADDRELFAQALPRWKTVKGYPPCKINKRTYQTDNLIGLPYGTVLEVGRDGLVPLPDGEDLLPDVPEAIVGDGAVADADGGKRAEGNDAAAGRNNPENDNDASTTNGNKDISTSNGTVTAADNRNLVDNNTSQKLTYQKVHSLISDSSTPGSRIVAALISNSSTFESKTAFSQAKYVRRKQLKYQPRCRIVRVTPATLCSAMHLKDQRRVSNLREDTLGQLLSNANVCAGQRALVMDDAVQGIVTAACTRRMGGYGSVISLHSCNNPVPGYIDVVNRMNFTLGERQCLKWVHLGEVFADYDAKAEQTRSMRDGKTGALRDVERKDREAIRWPAPLQPHTRDYLLEELRDDKKIGQFLARRGARFTRKLTRYSMLELRELADGCHDPTENLEGGSDGGTAEKNVDAKDEMDTTGDSQRRDGDGGARRQCDSLIVATKYDPTTTLLRLLPYLAPSCPFVVYHEFLEPLLETFRMLQNYHVPDAGENNGKKEKTDNSDGDANNADESTTPNTRQPPPMMLRRNVAINLRLTDAWFREYQILDGRTHPQMTMSQNGGYILTGTKLCPKTGTNELDEEDLREIRARIGGRRSRMKGGKKKRKDDEGVKDKADGDGKRAKTN